MNPLVDVLSPALRKLLYSLLFVAAVVFAAWTAADGDWLEFTGGLITAFLGLLAASNTRVE